MLKKDFQLKKIVALIDKMGKGNVVLDLAISAWKYPKVVTQEKQKCQGIYDSVIKKYVIF